MSVKCQAHDCTHNGQGCCYAGAISVHGNQAHSTSQTACKTYTPGVGLNTEFAAEFGLSEKQTNTHSIKCHASNCRHNKNLHCQAETVSINANTASCETFED